MINELINVYKQLFKIVIILLIITTTNELYSQNSSDIKKNSSTSKNDDNSDKKLDLSRIIPKSLALQNDLIILKNSRNTVVNDSLVIHKFNEIELYLANFDTLLKKSIIEDLISINGLIKLREQLQEENRNFQNVDEHISESIQKNVQLREHWLIEKQKWSTWDTLVPKENLPDQIIQAFLKTDIAIDSALNIINPKLNTLFKLQERGFYIQTGLNSSFSQISILLKRNRDIALGDDSSNMLSGEFKDKFNDNLWLKTKQGIKTVTFPKNEYFQSFWWLILLQFLITVLVILIIKNNKTFLINNNKYAFLADRSISAGLFFGTIFSFIVYSYYPRLQFVNLVFVIIGALSFWRLISQRKQLVWKKYFLYVATIVLVVTGVFDVINLPSPLFRVFVVLFSALGMLAVFYWWRKGYLNAKSKGKYWVLYPVTLYLFIVLISEILGKEILALFMYESLLKTIGTFVFLIVFVGMIRAGVKIIFQYLSNKSLGTDTENINNSIKQVSTFITVFIVLFFLIPRLLFIWGGHSSSVVTMSNIMAYGFNIGSFKITIGIIITSIAIIYASIILATVLELLIMNNAIDNKKLDVGTRLSIAHLIRYFLVFVGFVLGIASLGFDLTNFTIVLSALSVGIGFGLQGVVNSFVSGLILLFERPIREGDTIEIDGSWAEVKKIGLRSTKVQTFDQSDLIIPNANLIYNNITNWTLTNKRKRIKIVIGAAYGSNVALIIKTLKEVGNANPDLVKSYKPIVLFLDFSDSSLRFEFRVYAKNAVDAIQVESDLRQEIDRRFREANITIAFPQRDLHLRSVDPSITINPTKNEG